MKVYHILWLNCCLDWNGFSTCLKSKTDTKCSGQPIEETTSEIITKIHDLVRVNAD